MSDTVSISIIQEELWERSLFYIIFTVFIGQLILEMIFRHLGKFHNAELVRDGEDLHGYIEIESQMKC